MGVAGKVAGIIALIGMLPFGRWDMWTNTPERVALGYTKASLTIDVDATCGWLTKKDKAALQEPRQESQHLSDRTRIQRSVKAVKVKGVESVSRRGEKAVVRVKVLYDLPGSTEEPSFPMIVVKEDGKWRFDYTATQAAQRGTHHTDW